MRSTRSTRSTAFVLALALAAAGCADEPIAPESTVEPSFARGLDGASPGWSGLPVFQASQLRRAFPGSPCLDEAHRQFDFWVGDWNVFDTADNLIGTNFVTLELDGCLVQEHWTGGGGGQGRSLNTYDSETGLWYQSWVTQFPFGHTRTDGGLQGDNMVLTDDERLALLTDGSFAQILDIWTWIPDGPDQVTQIGEFRVPAVGFVSIFTGVYKRSDDVQPVAPLPTTQCQPGGVAEANRQLDFMLGAWSVAPADGRALATSTISTDLQDCLVEEHFATHGPHPLEAVVYNYFDPRDGLFHRIWVDSEGERVEQSGSFDGSALVLTGIEHVDGVPMLLRTSIAPGADGGFTVSNEVSADEGATWSSALDLEYGAG